MARIFFVFLFLFLFPCSKSKELLSLSNGKTLVSGDTGLDFELGFFQPNPNVQHWYLGLWLKQDSNRVSLWVANRNTPLTTPAGTLELSDVEMVLLDGKNNTVWNASGLAGNGAMDARLLADGNFVVFDLNDPSRFLWQSFHFPSDTLIPHMKLGIGTDSSLAPWRSPSDPFEGPFQFFIELYEVYRIVIQDHVIDLDDPMERWNGVGFGDMPHIFQLNKNGPWFEFVNQGDLSRLTLVSTGKLEIFTWIRKNSVWKQIWPIREEQESKRHGVSTKNIILIVLAAVVVGVGISLIGFFVWRRLHDVTNNQGEQGEIELVEEIRTYEGFHVFELNVIKEATDDFSEANKLGQGGFGTVYKGRLSDGKLVAVKKVRSSSSPERIEEFKNEVRSISSVRHINLVRLEGFCCEDGERILIYEFLENSSLDQHLFDKSRSRFLSWDIRFRIIKGIAEGLSYLHNSTHHAILHRDLKPSNVLLDAEMIPKISDFGLAQIMEVGVREAETHRVVGTYGYMSEEYAMRSVMSEKSDVFSFGVTILEIVTGRRNLEYCNSYKGDSLLDYVWRNWTQGSALDVVDPAISIDLNVQDQVMRSINIGLHCVQRLPEARPLSRDVVTWLLSPDLDLPGPLQPDFYVAHSYRGESSADVASTSSSAVPETESFNDFTLSMR